VEELGVNTLYAEISREYRLDILIWCSVSVQFLRTLIYPPLRKKDSTP